MWMLRFRGSLDWIDISLALMAFHGGDEKMLTTFLESEVAGYRKQYWDLKNGRLHFIPVVEL